MHFQPFDSRNIGPPKNGKPERSARTLSTRPSRCPDHDRCAERGRTARRSSSRDAVRPGVVARSWGVGTLRATRLRRQARSRAARSGAGRGSARGARAAVRGTSKEDREHRSGWPFTGATERTTGRAALTPSRSRPAHPPAGEPPPLERGAGLGLHQCGLRRPRRHAVTHPEPLVVDLIAVYLPGAGGLDGVQRTCHELWTVATEDQPSSYSWTSTSGRGTGPAGPTASRSPCSTASSTAPGSGG